jgi:transglutaminase-like putative cysteine protease
MGFVEMIRRANAPLPAEHSVTFRLAAGLAVLTGVLACFSVGEISLLSTFIACVGTVVGMVFSYLTRARPWQWVKILLALAVLGIFGSFVVQILGAARVGQLSSIEVPLAGLFTWVQLIHSFDVPARRDLLFSLAASAALVTLGAAQAVSIGFIAYVAIWLAACLVALACSWRSMTGGVGPLALGSLAITGLVVVLSAGVFLVFLPAPRAAQSITLPASLTSYLPLRDPGGVTGSGSQAGEPAQAGKATGRTGVGGYLGFASELDTAIRGGLSDEVVMRVRADRPGYFLGMTFDTWDGENWRRSRAASRLTELTTGSPFLVASALSTFAQSQPQPGGVPPLPSGEEPAYGLTNVQTFYVVQPMENLLFATADATEAYFPEHSLIVGADGSMRSTVEMNPGTVYTVVSSDTALSPSRLAKLAPEPASQLPAVLQADLELPPGHYARVAALARRIVNAAGATTTYAEVSALEAWMGRNVRYSTDIPPLQRGQDAVDQFLFGTRVGYCEQISTALAVMLRTLEIPTREAIGYVPGPYDPLSDMYEIQAKDAHAWVQVWFPGAGWQSFDPTAQVPLAPPDPGAVLLSDVGHFLARLPWTAVGTGGGALAALALVLVGARRRRSRPKLWVERVSAELERRGSAAGLHRRPAETLGEYASRLEALGRWRAGRGSPASLRSVAALVERAAYGGQEPDRATRAFVEGVVRGLRPARRIGSYGPRRRLRTV